MNKQVLLYLGILAVSLVAPYIFPDYRTQLAFLWVMVLFAMTWDIMGGQMGYNSFGNIVFFGLGAYTTAVIQRDLGMGYFPDFFIGVGLSAVIATMVALVIGAGILGLRGHYFAIGSLGLGIAAGEIAGGIDFIGAGSGMTTPQFPGELGGRELFFYFFFFITSIIAFFTLKWVYSGRFGLAINAIRDDEDKAEAMGIRTTRYKTVAWMISAFFLGITGAGAGNLIGFIDPKDVAFAGPTFGVWMVLMAILGGKGTMWGPVIGAVIFHVMQELFWTYLLGWQRVALGVLIVVIVVFFPQGIMGWIREQWPHKFGHKVATEEGDAK